MTAMKTAVPVLVLLSCCACLAQTPAFDEAAIHPAAAGNNRREIGTSPGSLTIRNQSLMFMIQWAYDMPPFQTDGPDWLNDARFDVIARAEAGGDDDRLRLMLQALLADRFGLEVHHVQKEMQVYAVTLAKGGPKFQESTDDGPPVFERREKTMLTAHRVTVKDLAAQFSEPLGRPVIDETGLTRHYDIQLDVSSYMKSAAGDGDGKDGGSGQIDAMSVLFTGLQQELGLKLVSKKMSVDILVVDHAEKTPTAN